MKKKELKDLAFKEPVYVTQPMLPEMELVFEKIKEIWSAKWLTNFGKQHEELKVKLKDYLKCTNISLFTNGTLALECGCKALELEGEVITTPFTFPATPHALANNGIKPVFCDIEPETLNLDPERIEELITPLTTGIMPVHVFGRPCNTEAIQDIANSHGLKLFYDAAHAFGVKINGNSLCNYGDMSMLSFHATKVFNTVEGGALIYGDSNLEKKLHLLKHFGLKDWDELSVPGTNAKMNEVQAAIGLINLESIEGEIQKRKKLTEVYRKGLKNISGIKTFNDELGVRHNYSYFPILIDEKEFGFSRDVMHDNLKRLNVFTRKYFYPLCSDLKCYKDKETSVKGSLVNAEKVSKECLCLPLYGGLNTGQARNICRIIELYHRENE